MPVTVPDIHEAVGKGLLKEENEISDLTAGKPQNSHFSLHQIQFLLLSLNVQNVSWQSSLGYAMATCGSEQTFLCVSALWLSSQTRPRCLQSELGWGQFHTGQLSWSGAL